MITLFLSITTAKVFNFDLKWEQTLHWDEVRMGYFKVVRLVWVVGEFVPQYRHYKQLC